MKILVACEESGRVRNAFNKLGHDAISCDLLPSATPGPHIQGDVTKHLRRPWDLVIAHPPCTYLANSGVHLLHSRPGRWKLMREGAAFFKACLDANAPHVAVENPTMHGYAQELVGGTYNFSVQPWQFGHGMTKRTGFWVRNLPPLLPTNVVKGREQFVMKMGPSKTRVRDRSRTFPGIAQAMAEQWGRLLL